MIVVEYEFIKNSKGVTSQFRIYHKGKVHSPIYRSEFAEDPRCPVVSGEIESIIIGWAVKPDFVMEYAKLIGPYKWNVSKEKYERIDLNKEKISWLVAIRKKGGKTYDE